MLLFILKRKFKSIHFEYFTYKVYEKEGDNMKKYLTVVLMMVVLVGLSGCSEGIIEQYPQIEEDFTEEDYNDLRELSNNGKLSYEDLCQEFINTKVDKKINKIIDDLKTIGKTSNWECEKEKKQFDFSFDFTTEEGTIEFEFKTDTKKYDLKSICFDCDSISYDNLIKIISIFEGNGEFASNIYSSISRSSNISDKIYAESSNFYYLPIENDKIRVYTSKYDFDETYKSSKEYWENKINENEEQIKELEKDLEKTEEMY